MSNFKLEWLSESRKTISSNSWIQFDQQYLIGFVNKDVVQQQPVSGYQYVLRAINKEGNYGEKTFTYLILGPRDEPSYKRRLFLHTTDQIIKRRTGVEIVFHLQEMNLLPYSMKHNQGINNVQDMITVALQIQRNNSGFFIDLTWSDNQFVSKKCIVEDIIRLRRKTTGSYENKYKEMFRKEYNFTKVEEIFSEACQHISIDPPLIGPDPINCIVKYGHNFNVTIPAHAFKAPITGKTMELTLELQTVNGKALSETSWIALNGTTLAEGITVHGYVTYYTATQQKKYQFQLVARTPLLEEVRISFEVVIASYELIRLDFMVTFFIHSIQRIDIKDFSASIADYLSVKLSTVVLYNLEVSKVRTVLQWTLSSSEICNTNVTNSYKKKLISKEGQPRLKLMKHMHVFRLSHVTIDVYGCKENKGE